MSNHLPTGAGTLLTAFTLLSLTAAPAQAGSDFALSLNGANSYVDTGAAVIPASGDFTVEVWANCPVATSSHREILSQGSSGNALYIGTDWANYLRLGDTWSSTGIPFPFGGWHHLALVKSSTNTLLYLDGIHRLSKGTPIANPAAATGLRLGRQYGAIGEYWPGQIDEVRIWDVARSSEEIRTNMNFALTGNETHLMAYWPFGEGPGSATTDDASGQLLLHLGD